MIKSYVIKLESGKTLKGIILKKFKEVLIVLAGGKFLAVSRKHIKSLTEEVSIYDV
jgi:hypothetical protein